MHVESIVDIMSQLRNITSFSEFELYSIAHQKQMIQVLAVGLNVKVPDVFETSATTALEDVRDEVNGLKTDFMDVVRELGNIHTAIINSVD